MRCLPPLRLLAALCAGLTAGGLRAAPPAPNELGRLIIKNFSPRDFVGNPQVWQIARDADGVLYFGNGPGYVTHDGVTWRRNAIQRPTDICRAVVLAPDGKLYAAGENFFGWLRPTGPGQNEFVPLTHGLPDEQHLFGWAENVAPHAGSLYLNAAKSIFTWRDGQLRPLPEILRDWTHILHGDRGPHYAIGPDRGFYRIEGERSVLVSRDPALTHSQIRFCATAADGSLLVVQMSGDIWALRDGQARPWPHEHAEFLRAKTLARGWQLPDGTLVLALLENGLAFYSPDGRFLAHLDESSGLRNNIVLGVLAGGDGLWLGLFNGAAHVDWPAAVTLFDRRSGLPTSSVREVRRAAGKIHALTAEGMFRLAPASGPEAPARFEKILPANYYSLLPTDTGFLVANDLGFVVESTPAGYSESPAPSLQGSRAYALYRSRHQRDLVWIGLENGVALVRRTPDGWRDEGRVPGFSENVQSLAEAPDGRIWGSLNGRGVFRLTPGRGAAGRSPAAGAIVEFFPIEPGRPAISRVANWGGELVFTAVEGESTVFRFDESSRKLVPFPGVPPLPDGQKIAGMVFGADATDHLWLRRTFTRNEDKLIYRVARDGRVQALPQRLHDAIDNVQQFFEESGPDGPVLWIAGTDGLLRVDVNRAFPPPTPFKTLVWTSGERVADGAVRPYAQNELDFEFVAPRYSPTFPVQYRTRLVGDNDSWSGWSADRKRAFARLAAGAYRLEVQSRDVDGQLGQPATFAFTILPPWWRTWWAYGGYGVAGVLLLAGLVSARTRVLRRKNEQLEKLIALRTDDLRRQNSELARLHKLELDEKITARLGEEKARLEVLRYQLNPHFLFNSLTSIRSQIPPALATARETLDRLADFCRLTLHGRKHAELTTVGEELAMLRTYLDIEQTRMGELLSVAFETDPSLDAEPLPRLLLLPLVENALKYGQATSPDTLALRIAARRTPAGMAIEIANTGEWVERGSRRGLPSMGIGHENLTERLLRHYPGAHEFTHSAVDGWVCVRILLRATPNSPA